MDPDTYEGTIIAAFHRQARLRPQKIAIVDESTEWTFAELYQRVDRIAAHLLYEGVTQSTYVGIHLRPSAELVACLLAVLKVGAAYVPIDKSTPLERFRFIVEDAGLRFVISDNDSIDGLRPLRLQNLLQPGDNLLDAYRCAYPQIREHADAYVIYTSGSTGKPKGVICTHRNVMRLLSSTEEEFCFSEMDRWTLFHSIAFDFSVWEVFGALLYGGTLVIVGADIARDTLRFARLLKDQRITVLNQTPSAFYNLLMAVDSHGIDCFSELRYVILGGERVQCAKLARWFTLKGEHPAKLVNMYGITETTVHVTYREITAEDVRTHPESSPIGRPIRDLSVYLLDDNMRPVADGDIGEICVAGPGVAKGYLGRPELTARRFISNPFDNGTTGKVYRSGDLGRQQSGELFYIGRADRQVKIRGYRIEVGEIESALLAGKGVAGAHVLALEAGTTDARLVAHVVPDERIWAGACAEAAVLRRKPNGLFPLKNGLEVAYLNKQDTLFMYKEIFEDHLYETLGVNFPDGARVIDVGANIGIFCLHVMTRCRNPRLVAVEPDPACAAVLDVNLKRYGANASVHTIGLSDHVGTARLRHIDQATAMSGQYPGRDKDIAKTSYRSHMHGKSSGAERLDDAGVDQGAEKLESSDLVCQLDTLSNLIDREGLQLIDVLRIDVDKSEANVLYGVRDDHWPLIGQLIVQAHNIDRHLDRMKDLLETHGYSCIVDRDTLPKGTPRCNLYAWRGESPHRSSTGAESTPTPGALTSQRDALLQHLRTSLAKRLPAYMIPAEIHLVPEFPLTINGKVDEQKLLELEPRRLGHASREAFDPVEHRVKDIWLEVLKVKQIDLDVTLEDAGAHSLAAVMIAVRLFKAFGIEVPAKELRGSASISSVARRIREQQASRSGDPERRPGVVI